MQNHFGNKHSNYDEDQLHHYHQKWFNDLRREGAALYEIFMKRYRQRAHEALVLITQITEETLYRGEDLQKKQSFAYANWFSKLWREVRRTHWFIHARI